MDACVVQDAEVAIPLSARGIDALGIVDNRESAILLRASQETFQAPCPM